MSAFVIITSGHKYLEERLGHDYGANSLMDLMFCSVLRLWVLPSYLIFFPRWGIRLSSILCLSSVQKFLLEWRKKSLCKNLPQRQINWRGGYFLQYGSSLCWFLISFSLQKSFVVWCYLWYYCNIC